MSRSARRARYRSVGRTLIERAVVEAHLGVRDHELNHLRENSFADNRGHLSKCLRLTEAIQSSEQRALSVEGISTAGSSVEAIAASSTIWLRSSRNNGLPSACSQRGCTPSSTSEREHGVYEVRRFKFGDAVEAHVVT